MKFTRLTKLIIKLSSIFLGLALILIGFNNCSGAGSGFSMGYCNGSCVATVAGSSASIYITTQSATMSKGMSKIAAVVYRQQMQISGVCNTGGAAANSITFSVTQNGTPFLTDLYGATYASKATVCDNGRYFIILTPPFDPNNNNISVISNVTPTPMFQLTTQINTGPTTAALIAGPKFLTNFYVSY